MLSVSVVESAVASAADKPARQRAAARPDGRGDVRAHRVGVVEVDVGKKHRTVYGVRRRRAGDAGGFRDRAVLDARRNRGGVIGAGDGDGDRLCGAGAVVVGHGDAVGDGQCLAGGEEVEGLVRGAEGKSNRAGA